MATTEFILDSYKTFDVVKFGQIDRKYVRNNYNYNSLDGFSLEIMHNSPYFPHQTFLLFIE